MMSDMETNDIRQTSFCVLIAVFVLIVIFPISVFAAEKKTKDFVLIFPKEYSMGELYPLKPGAGSSDSEPATSAHFPARGVVKCAAGSRLLLKVGFDGSSHLAELDKLPVDGLFGINLKRMEIADDDLKHVGRLTGLHHLELEGTDVTAKGIAHLGALKNLHFLGVDKTLINGDATKTIGKLTNVENLVFGHNDLSDECFKDLLPLIKLENLHADNVHMSDKAIDYICKFPKLRNLKLSGNNRISDRAMTKLQNTKVESVNVQNTGVSIKSLPSFLKMPELDYLKLEKRNFKPDEQRLIKSKLPKVNVVFEGKEKDFPKGMFDPLH